MTELEIVCSASRFVELHFTSGRDGWTDEMIEMHRKLAQRIHVKIEEAQGLEMCTISVHNVIHIHEDINFSATTVGKFASFKNFFLLCEQIFLPAFHSRL